MEYNQETDGIYEIDVIYRDILQQILINIFANFYQRISNNLHIGE